ncbi:MAG: YceD family protein [Actinomycetota bacterium]
MIDVDVRELIAHPGSSRHHRLRQPVAGLRVELAAVPHDAPVEGDLLLESVVEGILVSGPLTGPLMLSCARCLKEFAGRVDVDVQELFSPNPERPVEEYVMTPEGSLDLEPMVRDSLMLALPFSPLCRADCLGLCERCGGDRNLEECSCAEEPVDARWAALESLFADAPEGGDRA